MFIRHNISHYFKTRLKENIYILNTKKIIIKNKIVIILSIWSCRIYKAKIYNNIR